MLQSQENSLVTEDREWASLWEICGPDYITYQTFYTRFHGDTMVNGKEYKKVEIAEDEDAQVWKFSGEFVREENNRVFYLGNFLEEEMLLYDFNLKVGKQVKVWNVLEPDGIVLQVTHIDSVLTFDGYRKRMHLEFDEFSVPEVWIEGVGSESGVLNSSGSIFLGICNTYFLLCSTDNGFQVYQNPEYETCYYNLLGREETETKVDTIFLNYVPITRTLTLHNTDHESVDVLITGITGQVVYRSQTNDASYEIDLSSLKSGFYVVSIRSKGIATFKKILIN